MAIKHTAVDNVANTEPTNQWETYKVSAAGKVDYNSQTWGDAYLHEVDLNQDLDGNDSIWTASQQSFTSVDSDTQGATPYLDSTGNLYIQAAGTTTKNQIVDTSGAPANFSESVDLGTRTLQPEVVAVETTTITDKKGTTSTDDDVSTNYWKLLIREIETSKTDANDVSTHYQTFNINAVPTSDDYLKLDWMTAGWYSDPKSLESTFNIDLNLDGSITTINTNSTTAVATDTTGAQLRKTADGSLFIKDSDTTIQVTGTDGGFVNLDVNDTFTGGSFKSQALAAQKVGDNYKVVVKETNAYGSNTDILYQVLTINSEGQIKWGDVEYRTAAELNEVEFGQDLTSDGVVGSGSSSASSDTYASSVTSGTTDGEVKAKFEKIAQSDFVSISNENADEGATDTKIEMFVKGVEGGSKDKFDMDVKIVQQASDALMAKIATDAGLDQGSTDALTGLLDFSITINDKDNYGKIVSMSWVLPESTTSPKYLKRNPVSGQYADFAFDSATGEGAKWDQTTSTLTVYVRDNGIYDQDSSLGVVRDPALIISEAEALVTTSTTSAATTIAKPTSTQVESLGIAVDSLVISPSTTSTTTAEPITVKDSDLGDTAQVELATGIDSKQSITVDFSSITKNSSLDKTRATSGGGTISSNAPSNSTLEITGVYYNSAAGDDEITGSNSNDFVRAGSGDDIVIAGAGDDLIRGGAGSDQITTGSGADTIYWTVDQLDSSADTVTDFVVGEDQIAIESAISVSVDGNLLTFTATIDDIQRSSTVSLTGLDSFDPNSIIVG